MNGYIKLHRKLVEWGWYSDSVVKDVFLHILMTASYAEGQYMGFCIEPGQAIIKQKNLAAELGFSPQQIRTALKKLESTGEIVLNPTNRFTIATVENWRMYQDDDEQNNKRITLEQHSNNTQITNEQQTDNTRATNLHILKESKKVRNKEINKESGRVFTPPSVEQVREYCSSRGNSVDAESFVDFYESKGWMVGKNKMKDWKAAVRTWERSRNEKQDAVKEKKKYDFTFNG